MRTSDEPNELRLLWCVTDTVVSAVENSRLREFRSSTRRRPNVEGGQARAARAESLAFPSVHRWCTLRRFCGREPWSRLSFSSKSASATEISPHGFRICRWPLARRFSAALSSMITATRDRATSEMRNGCFAYWSTKSAWPSCDSSLRCARMTGGNMDARPNAVREIREMRAQAPWLARALRPVLIVHHRLRRLAGGIYFRPFPTASTRTVLLTSEYHSTWRVLGWPMRNVGT